MAIAAIIVSIILLTEYAEFINSVTKKIFILLIILKNTPMVQNYI